MQVLDLDDAGMGGERAADLGGAQPGRSAFDPLWADKLTQEARLTARIEHPGIVRVTDAGADARPNARSGRWTPSIAVGWTRYGYERHRQPQRRGWLLRHAHGPRARGARVRPLSAPQLADVLQIHARTARRMLARLADEAYVVQLGDRRRRYALTMRLVAVAGQALEHHEFTRIAVPFVGPVLPKLSPGDK